MGSLLVLISLLVIAVPVTLGTDVSWDDRALIINGDHKIMFSGSIHYPRSTPEMWPDLIQKAKDGGLDAIETYVFWNAHEPQRRQYDFEGRNDLVRFIKTIQEVGMYAVLRIGPYVCAEWNYGGFPTWLHTMPGIELRTDNAVFENEMGNFTTLIVDMLRQEKLFAPQGGPIIIAQIENEYGNIMWQYGDAGKKYVEWCANLAESFNLGIAWVMCQQADAPPPMINTCNGWYCDKFTQTNPNTPKMWTENWTGWFKAWGEDNNLPHRRVEDIAYAVARFYQTGGTFQNYYMYHGGTNFGRVTGGPYITTTYDYDAPLDEFGHPNEPKYSHLKGLHTVLKSMETVLTKGTNSTEEFEDGASATTYEYDGVKSCFLSNTNDTKDITIPLGGKEYLVPAWSVSILPDCDVEAYNTAKITTQARIMMKKPGNLDEKLTWSWREENIEDQLQTKGTFSAPALLEQLAVTNDDSDYLWYMTSFNASSSDANKTMTLRVNTTGHGLYMFFNGKLVGSHYGPKKNLSFVLDAPVEVSDGLNRISLLSVTVGLANYGAYFDLSPTGIIGGPVQLIGNESSPMDLSTNQWTYKTGLTSLQDGYLTENYIASSQWATENLPINKMMTWYMTTFTAPLGLEPVVVNLEGLGKGEAWVNGHRIGRYWPASMSSVVGCPACDYRGQYRPEKCSTGCGHSSQKWYHIPRSFLKSSDNTLLLFEELGGNPLDISFHTVTTQSVCASVPEGKMLEISCSGEHSITEIKFASYGDASGECGSFGMGTCHSPTSLSVVQDACIGKSSCSVQVSDAILGESGCDGAAPKGLVVEALCH